MKALSQLLFWLGLLSVPFAWAVWYLGPEIEIIRPVLTNIQDPALRAAMQEAHAERGTGAHPAEGVPGRAAGGGMRVHADSGHVDLKEPAGGRREEER